MSDADNDDQDQEAADKYTFETVIIIKNPQLKPNVNIQPRFIKTVEYTTFTEIDYYQSIGIAAILRHRCPIPPMERDSDRARHHMRAFCAQLRKWRDAAFRKLVISKRGKKKQCHGIVKPHDRELKAIALQINLVHACMPAEVGVTPSCVVKCLCDDERKNRNSELWIELTHPVCQYISKVVAHNFENQLGEGDAQDVPNGGDDAAEQDGSNDEAGDASPAASPNASPHASPDADVAPIASVEDTVEDDNGVAPGTPATSSSDAAGSSMKAAPKSKITEYFSNETPRLS